jgi:phage portal protein BeeE
MPMLERVRGWIGRGGKREAVQAIPFHPLSSLWFGGGIGNQPAHTTLLAENLGIADTATRAIANRLSSLKLQVKTNHRLRDGTVEEEILDDHPLKLLLDRPHPNYTQMQMLRLLGQYIVTIGEAYLLKVGNRLSVPVELHPMLPWNVTPQLSQGIVQAYRVIDGDGRTIVVRAESVVRFYFPDPESPWTSEGYLGPTGIEVDASKFAHQHLRAHYQDDATPKTYLEAGPEATAFTAAEKTRFFAEWRESYHRRSGSQKGNPAITPSGYTLKELAFQSGAELAPLLEFWRDDVLMAFGTPRSILGQVVSGDRSSAETNQFVFDRHTILPIATLIADGFTSQLAPDFDSSLKVDFEPFVSEDKTFTLSQETADLTNKVRSINLVRSDRGLDPVEWGELPVGQLGQVPYDGSDMFELPTSGDGAIEDDEPEPAEGEEVDLEPEEPPRKRINGARADYFTPRAEWQRVVARERKFIPAFSREMRIIFTRQRDDVLAKLEELESRARATVDGIFDPNDRRWTQLFELRLEPLREGVFLQVLGETLSGLGIEEFVFTDAMRKTLKAQGAQLIQHANRTTKRRIAAELMKATEEGEGVSSIAKRIRGVFAERRKHHAVTIARTEIGKAQSSAQIEGFKLGGVERKEWMTSLDADVRETHQIHGQIVGIGEPFTLEDGELADAPRVGAGGSELSAHNSINCRCSVLPVVGQ